MQLIRYCSFHKLWLRMLFINIVNALENSMNKINRDNNNNWMLYLLLLHLSIHLYLGGHYLILIIGLQAHLLHYFLILIHQIPVLVILKMEIIIHHHHVVSYLVVEHILNLLNYILLDPWISSIPIAMLYISFQESYPAPVFIILTFEYAVFKAKSIFLISNSGHMFFRSCLMIHKIIDNSRRKFANTTMLWTLACTMMQFKALGLLSFKSIAHFTI